jgi:transcriptional regulator with XRE-family HTH domain
LVRPVDPDRLLRNLGRRLAEARAERGLTQEQLAELVDVSARYVQSVEAGNENLTVRTLAKFATVLEIPLADMFLAPTKPKPGPVAVEREITVTFK